MPRLPANGLSRKVRPSSVRFADSFPQGGSLVSNFVVRASRVAPQHLAVALVGGVAQLPHVVLPLPDVGRAETVGQIHKVIAVHPGLLKQLAGPREMLAIQRQILKDLFFKFCNILHISFITNLIHFSLTLYLFFISSLKPTFYL